MVMKQGGTNGIDRRTLIAAAASGGAVLAGGHAASAATQPARRTPPGTEMPALEIACLADAPTSPTGLAIDAQGRALLFMPRLDDKTLFSIGLVAADGSVSPWPDAAINRPDPQRPQDTLFHISAGVFDAAGRLWVADAGLMAASGPPVPGAAKLVCFDPGGRVLRVIPLGAVTEKTSSLNDLRVHAGMGGRETAFVTDQGQDGQGALLAIDLATGGARRRLAHHSSTARYLRLPVRLGGTQAKEAVRAIVALEPDRVIFAHGRIFDGDGAVKVRRAFKWLV